MLSIKTPSPHLIPLPYNHDLALNLVERVKQAFAPMLRSPKKSFVDGLSAKLGKVVSVHRLRRM